MMPRHLALLAAMLALAACSSPPPPPDWKVAAYNQLENFTTAYLEGATRRAESSYLRARDQIARSGRLDLLARAELQRCAVLLAGLETPPCSGFDALSAHATPAERTYYRFLRGDWENLDAAQLPERYRGLLGTRDATGMHAPLAAIADPVSRSIAAGVLMQKGLATPAVIGIATQTASDQGWRRPLLFWLRVAEQRAAAVGDDAALATLRQRIQWVTSSLQAPP